MEQEKIKIEVTKYPSEPSRHKKMNRSERKQNGRDGYGKLRVA